MPLCLGGVAAAQTCAVWDVALLLARQTVKVTRASVTSRSFVVRDAF